MVLDECGAGTLSADGAGIAAAAAAFLGGKGTRSFLPTHHGELAQSSLMSRLGSFKFGKNGSGSVGVAAMKVLAREEATKGGGGEKEGGGGGQEEVKTLVITPLFRLEPAPDGPSQAFGLAAAAAAGMPAEVVRRAREVAAAAASAAGAAASGGNSFGLTSSSSSSSSSSAAAASFCDPRLSAACAGAAGRAARLLARVATLPLASAQGGRLCEEARLLLEEALQLGEEE